MAQRAAFALLALGGIAACSPPPSDEAVERERPVAEPTFASDPLPSPVIEGAAWAKTSDKRIIYGIAGEPALMALECDDAGEEPVLRVTRMSPADEGAGALLALIGNGHIGRLEVDATEVSGRILWQGELPADDPRWAPIAGPRQVTATIPGAGMLTINPSPAPMGLLALCRQA
ncbi:MAG: hypothetical protein AAF687_01165 [Pseudomonadota bacterium]